MTAMTLEHIKNTACQQFLNFIHTGFPNQRSMAAKTVHSSPCFGFPEAVH